MERSKNEEIDKWDGTIKASNEEIYFRESMTTLDENSRYKVATRATGGQVAAVVGDVAGAGYLRMTLDPTKPDQKIVVYHRIPFRLPASAEIPITLSQRLGGYTHSVAMVGTSQDGAVETDGVSYPNRPITSDITVATNVWTITMSGGHTFHAGDLVYLSGCQDSRLNVGWVAVTSVVSPTVITITSTLANATYTVGASGRIEELPADWGMSNIHSLIMGGAQTTSQGQIVDRQDSRPFDITAVSTLTTSYLAPTAPISSAYCNSITPTAIVKMLAKSGLMTTSTQAVNSTTLPTQVKSTRTVPNQDKKYLLQFTAYAQNNITVPVGGGISSISKAGSTTCTVVFRSAHGLTTSDQIVIYGVRDQTNFINTTTAAAVLSIVSPTSITCTIAGTGTATSYGGQVLRVNGGNTHGAQNVSIQSVSCVTTGELTMVLNASMGTHLVGESIWIGGVYKNDGSGTFTTTGWAEGYYQILKNDTTTFNVIVSVPGLATFGSVNVGGAIIKCVDFNIHNVKVNAFVNNRVEIIGTGSFQNDGAESIPVNIITNGAGSTPQAVAGVGASGATTSGNPVRTGGRARTGNTAVTDGQTADYITTLVGSQIVTPYTIPELCFQATDSITASTTAIQLRPLTASNRVYCTGFTIQSAALGTGGIIQLGDVAVASTTATISSNTLVMSATYGWKVGDMVYVTASSVTGLTAASYYYILTVSTTSLTFSATRGGGTLSISGSSVSATLRHIHWIGNLGTAATPLTHVTFPTPTQTGTGIGLEMCTPTSLGTGRVDFTVFGYTAP